MNNDFNKIMMHFKNVLRRRIRYHQRKKEQLIRGNHSNKNDLNQKKNYYNSIKCDLIKSIKDYQMWHLNETISKPTTLMPNAEIISNNGDWLGKVFKYNDQFYRGINENSVNDFCTLWRTGIIQVFSKYGLIPVTTISDYYSDNYPIILHHVTVDVNSSKAWCFDMIKDACIFSCIIRDVLNQFGYTLFDGHLNNVVFYKNKPVFLDIGSITKYDDKRDGFSWELAFSGLYRLIFYLFGNNVLKHIQVYDEANNAIWIKPWHYDNALEEYYFYLKKFKTFGIIHNSFLVNFLIFRVFDCYDLRPEYIDILFQYKTKKLLLGEKKNNVVVNLAKKVLGEVKDVLGINLESYKTMKMLSSISNNNYKLVIDDDVIANQLYRIEKEQNGEMSIFLHNIMYPSDKTNLNNIRSELVIAENIENNISCFHTWKYDSLVSNFTKITKKYLLVSASTQHKKIISELNKRFSIIDDFYYEENDIKKYCVLCSIKWLEDGEENVV